MAGSGPPYDDHTGEAAGGKQLSWATVPTSSVLVGDVGSAYRTYGPAAGVPVVFLNHLGANLDSWDPRVVDGIAAAHRVIVFDNKGIGASGGEVPQTVPEMAHDAVAFIQTLELDKVDLFGFSLGGFIAQVIADQHPELVRKLILAGTGPAGGEGIVNVAKVTYANTLTAVLARKDPKQNLFFTRTTNGKAQAQAFIKRIRERTEGRDKATSLTAFRTQLRAIHAWGAAAPADLGRITQPVLVANGEHDRMVPTSNSYELARRLPNATLRIYSDAGHGGIFQAHERFVPEALEFLRD